MPRTWILLFLFCSFKTTFCLPKRKIFIGALVESRGEYEYGYRTAMEYATEIINNRSDILRDYEIVVKYANTYASPVHTALGVYSFLYWANGQPIQILIGPARSRNTELAAMATGSSSILQISYGPKSVDLQNDKNYNKLFCNVPATSSLNNARVAVLKHFGWKRVGILYEYDHRQYSSTVLDFLAQMGWLAREISIVGLEGYQKVVPGSGHPKAELQILKERDARILIGVFSMERAAEVFCEAYKLGMYGPKYVWFVAVTSSEAWTSSPESFLRRHNASECEYEEIAAAAAGFITITNIEIRQDNKTSASGLTASEYLAEVRRRNCQAQPNTSYAFDSIWAAALMFNWSFYTTLPGYFGLQVQEFEGLSGPHKFLGRDRLGTVMISQMRVQNGTAKLVQIGTHEAHSQKLIMNEAEVKKMWEDGKVPTDQTRNEKKVLMYSMPQLITVDVLAVLGLFFTVGLLGFNIACGNLTVRQNSSPMMNNAVLLGCSLCYAFVLLLGIDSRFLDDYSLGILCNVRLYILSIGFSLAFGALFSQTFRVYKIFTAKRAIKKKTMRDFHLILFVIVLVFIDGIFITVWVIFNPLKSKDSFLQMQYTDDLITFPVKKICDCSHGTALHGALYGYKGILLLFGVFMARKTRNVTVPGLKDSKCVGKSLFNVAILSAIGAITSMILTTKYHDILYLLISLVILFGATDTLTKIFLPKLREYYKTKHESQARVYPMVTLNTNRKAIATTPEDVYEAFVDLKDVQNKCIQTEDFGEEDTRGNDSRVIDVLSVCEETD